MDFKHLLTQQKSYVTKGATAALNFRLQQLKKLKALIKENEQKVVKALQNDLAKPEQESFVSEIAIIYEEIKHTTTNLAHWMKRQRKSSPLSLFPAKSEIIYEPFGSTLIIAPWNYPFQLNISPLIASMAAGNAAVLKPSEVTPHTQELITELINSNFDSEYIHAIGGGIPESEELLKLPFDFIFFTGSTNVGKIVMKAAAENLTPVCLELGGKSPCIVDDNIDLEVAARRIVWGKFYNAGQTCVAPDYIYIKSSIKEKFLNLTQKYITEFFGENPQASSDYARIVNQKNFQRLQKMVLIDKIFLGGQTDEASLYFSPTILDNTDWSDPVMQEEIFGPIMPIMTYENIEEVITQINKQPKPLSLYLFTENKKIKEKIKSELSFGGGAINDVMVHLANPNLPFGGIGHSGMGAYHGRYGFELFSHKKSLVDKSFKLDLSLRYPPYSKNKLKWLKRLL